MSINNEEFDLLSEVIPHGIAWLAFFSFLYYVYREEIVHHS